MRKKIFYFFIIIISAGCLISRKILFYPVGSSGVPQIRGKLITADNGRRKVYSYFTRGNSRLIVFFHGQHGTISSSAAWAAAFASLGYSTLLVEYPGYGMAKEYYPSEDRIYSDSEAAIKLVQTTEKFSPENTVLAGYSLGTGPAAELALRKIGHRLILFAPYTSIPDVASWRYVKILPHLLIFDRFSTEAKAENIKVKTLIFHCTGDRAIPFRMSEELQKKFPNSRLVKIPGGNHSILGFLNANHWNEIRTFIQ